jgi:hypothetical protein
MVAEFIERGGWAVDGVQSPAHWLEWKCAIAPGTARDHVRVALALKELPKTTESFGDGRLSYSQVRAIARVATTEDEEHFVEIARFMTAGQLEKVIRGYHGVKREQELEKAKQRHADRRCDWHYDVDGSLVITAKLPPEDGAKVIAALESASDEVFEEPVDEDVSVETTNTETTNTEPTDVSAETRRKPRRRKLRGGKRAADALLVMAERSQCASPNARSGADRTTVMLHVDLDSLVNDSGELCDVDGIAIPPETARRLSCDARIVSILEKDGEPLKMGRMTRTTTVAQRRALEARDGCCVFPGCRNKAYTDGHHIDHWTRDHGETNVDRMALLCWIHHRLMHEGGFTMDRKEDGRFVFYRPDGTEVPEVRSLDPAEGPTLEKRNEYAGLALDSDTCAGDWDGKPIRLDLIVGSILHPDGAWF